MKTELEKNTINFVARVLNIPTEKISLSDSLVDDLAQDSIALFELVIQFEKNIGISAKYSDLIEIDTVGDIVKYIEKIGVSSERLQEGLD